MLQLHEIRKAYTTAGYTQNALDGVSVAFRDNEFAAILGPSGSGKTTMLNIIGGLDRYDSGDLEIDGISTKKYKDSDWDTYRNNRIGFVFQSYNLIPHQNVLANVELALTLSGVSKGERRQRAIEALEEVGLGKHIRKKPNQLSGGQMQRVAIARALVNDPEILLADEPTGALDSKTGFQVMELLTKIAEDRLVIMVTHNNELAEQYATRIVHLADGKVTSDSRPFDPSVEQQRAAAPPRRSRMSFWTAISLSFSNLMTKKGRTFTTAFAGSIGIIGIATILAFSNGINAYIRGIEEDTLSMYPLTIQQQAFDMSALFGGGGDDGRDREERRRERPEGTVREIQIMESVFSSQTLNDLASLKKHFDENESILDEYVTTIQYAYDITPQIYLADTSAGVDRIHPDSMFTGAFGGGNELPSIAGMGPAMMMNVFYELPNEPELYLSQYEVLTGHWPENYDEAVLVLQFGHGIIDFTLYSLGIRDRAEMQAMLESVMTGSETETEFSDSEVFYPYETLMTSFKVVNQAEIYHYDEIYEIWVDKSGDEAYMKELIGKSMDLKIVGIVQPLEDANVTMLSAGVNYSPDMVYHLVEAAGQTEIVKQQIAAPEVNVISGNTFEYEKENPPNSFDFSRILSVDEDAFRDAMGLDSLMDAFDPENMDFSSLDFSGMNLSGFDFGDMDFSEFDLEGLDFESMDFSEFDFGDMDFDDIDFGDMDMDDFDMGQYFGNLNFAADPDLMTNVLNDPATMARLMNAVLASNIVPPGAVEDVVQNFLFGLLMDPAVQYGLGYSLIDGGAALNTAINNYLNANTSNMVASMTSLVDPAALSSGPLADEISDIFAGVMQAYMMQLMGVLEDAITEMMEDIIGTMIEVMVEIMMTEVFEPMMTTMMEVIVEQITEALESSMTEITEQMADSMEELMGEIGGEIEKAMREMFEGIAEDMSMENFDGDVLAEAFRIDLSEETIYELMTAMMNPSTTSYEQNLSLLGYADMENPMQISIYPRSFEAKNEVLAFLDRYNEEMERTGQTEKVIYFTDIVGLMMSSVTNIIDIVSYALIAFVSVALVVSSIMIGVITFVSVLERKKEIGILRAVGASKSNIRLVFNAETLIIGFVAGVIGVVVTYFIAIIANAILVDLLGINNLVLIPPAVPFILVGISMFLTFIAGLIPASAAASRPPVEALRSE